MLEFVVLVLVVALSAFGLAGGNIDQFSNMTAGEIASMVFLGLVGIVFIGSIIGAGPRLANVSRHLAIALSVTLTVAIAWEYRYELQGAVTRITAGVVPGTPITQVGEDGALSVTISRVDRHFQALAKVNGKDQSFIVDTGASAVVLTYDSARNAGFDVERLSFSVPVATANGMARAAPVYIESLVIGEIERRNVRAMVAQNGKLFDNLLGLSFLNRLSGYDVRGSQMVLHN
ncbi:MAG: TIGR02281 family clan AA aspartic protease [Pseudomonadota bacterium]